MKYAVSLFCTEYTIRPDQAARAAEERGFDALFFPEHTHIPASPNPQLPGGIDMPREYYYSIDPFASIAVAAAATRSIKLGTGICLVVERDPIVLAKLVASLDLLSNGRILLGVGGGWNAKEMENHGTPFNMRWKILRERVQAMKAIWTQKEPAYHGRFVNFEPIWSYPKPVQRPHPPVLLGAHGSAALRKVVDYCDGWIPFTPGIKDLRAEIAQLRHMAGEAGRDPASLNVSVYFTPAERAVVDSYREAGADRVIFCLPPADAGTVVRALDDYARLIAD